jgi:diaminopimelate epimerase
MKFMKIQGAGNDFIIINNMELKFRPERFPSIAKHLCKRKVSMGADGLMAVDFPEGAADFRMHFYNSDGSIGEMCGNGARCISRYAYVNGLAGRMMKFETGAGIVSTEILNGRNVKVELIKPMLIKLNSDVDVGGKIYECSYIELGNPGLPHAVVKFDGLINTEEQDILSLGREIRFLRDFPKGANVNFYEIIDESTAVVKTYERGVEDFTMACGTGSASTAVALIKKGYIKGSKAKIIVPGGELFIEVEEKDGIIEKLYLTGDTNIIAVGEIMDEDLII